MRQLSADYIYTISSDPIKNGVITIDDSGRIINVASENTQKQGIDYYEGIICPGFINTHCHLELSHIRSMIEEKTGMADFIKNIVTKRNSCSKEQILNAIESAEEEMITNGIVAVADISNTSDTLPQKRKGNLYYHTFIELIHPDPVKAIEIFENGLVLKKEFLQASQPKSTVSLAPHAPYSMSEKLLQLINEDISKNNDITGIHNQESKGEDELFISKSGALYNLFQDLGFNTSVFRQTGVNALRSTLPLISKAKKILLVHNTFTTKEDIDWAQEQMNHSSKKESSLYWCTCPNANLYIENTLPNYIHFLNTGCNVTIGTDSLASNKNLSILDEIKTIAKHYPAIPLQTLLTWATKNGAAFMDLKQLGTIEKGKIPGLNLLTNINNLTLTDKTKVVRLA